MVVPSKKEALKRLTEPGQYYFATDVNMVAYFEKVLKLSDLLLVNKEEPKQAVNLFPKYSPLVDMINKGNMYFTFSMIERTRNINIHIKY